MAVTVFKTWLAGDVLTASDLNASFTQITNNGEDLAWPATKAKDLDGQVLILDADGDTTITADTDDQIDIQIAGADDFQITANTLTAISGSTIATNTIAETTAASGVTIDGLLIKDSAIDTLLVTTSGDMNGLELFLDADGDTSITADTDDQIDIKISAADDFQFTPNTFTALSGSTIAANTIAETTAASGVTIDGLLLKDLTIAGHIIGTDIQAWDAQLDDLAALAVTDGLFIVADGANWVAESGATAIASLGILATDQSWTGSQRSTYVALSDAATVLVDFNTEQNMYVTVTADRTIGAPSNQVDGQGGFLVVEQDGTGGHTTSFHADWDFGAAGTPTPDTAAGKKMLIAYIVDWDTTIMARHVEDF